MLKLEVSMETWSMLEAFYFGKGKPPETSEEDEILQLVSFFGFGGFFRCVLFCFVFCLISCFFKFKQSILKMQYFSVTSIFFKIFEVFLSKNEKVNVKYSYAQKMVGFQDFNSLCENFMVLCFN